MEPKIVIVFIHGFLGSVRQFIGTKKQLEGCGADFADHNVDGHSGPLDEFVKSRDKSWQDGLNKHLDRLREEYDKIYLVGHSMGGLLAVRAAVAQPEKIGGVAAIAFPIKIAPTLLWVKLMRNASLPPSEGEDPRITFARDLGGVEIKSVGELCRAFPNSVRLMRLIRRTRDELPSLKIPLTVLNAEKDEIVSVNAANFTREKLQDVKVRIMRGSYHFMFGTENEKIIADAIREMIAQKGQT